jgi:hypothetical protein
MYIMKRIKNMYCLNKISYYIKMVESKKGGNAQMYNTQGLIQSNGYTHTVAGTSILPPVFAGAKIGGASASKKKPASKAKPKSKAKKPSK